MWEKHWIFCKKSLEDEKPINGICIPYGLADKVMSYGVWLRRELKKEIWVMILCRFLGVPSTSSLTIRSNGLENGKAKVPNKSERLVAKDEINLLIFRHRHSNPDVFCVALPPTITRKELKNAKKLQLQKEKAVRGKLLEATIEQLSQVAKFQTHHHKKNVDVSKSIFCSVEMLAESG